MSRRVITDAGGKNLESLLYETVFDSNASSDLVSRINVALRDGTMTEPSLRALRELTVEKNGETYSLLHEEEGGKRFDWRGLQESNISREKIDSVFASIKSYQEWNGGLRVGFKDVPEPLIRAAMEHRLLVIDEFAGRKPGTEGPLQQVWRVINGEIPELTVSLGNLGQFTLRHGDIPRVIMTSNKPKDGLHVNPLSTSLESRVYKMEIPSFTEDDWAHRIAQILTGVPVTTLARLEKGRMVAGEANSQTWEVANPVRFKSNLRSIRTTGAAGVPPMQSLLLEHYPAVIAASQALAKAYHQSQQLLNPESRTLQKGEMIKLRAEVENPGDPAPRVTPRDAIRLLKEAIERNIESVPATETQGADFSDWSMPAVAPTKENPAEHLGDRIRAVAERWIDNVAGATFDGVRRPELYKHLRRVWTEAGILGPDSVLQGLNIHSEKSAPGNAETEAARHTINQLLKARYPDFEGITSQQVEAFLASLSVSDPEIRAE